MHLSASEAESDDEDVAYERRRVASQDVGDDVLVLQDLTKVRLFVVCDIDSIVLFSDVVFFSCRHLHLDKQISFVCDTHQQRSVHIQHCQQS